MNYLQLYGSPKLNGKCHRTTALAIPLTYINFIFPGIHSFPVIEGLDRGESERYPLHDCFLYGAMLIVPRQSFPQDPFDSVTKCGYYVENRTNPLNYGTYPVVCGGWAYLCITCNLFIISLIGAYVTTRRMNRLNIYIFNRIKGLFIIFEGHVHTSML